MHAKAFARHCDATPAVLCARSGWRARQGATLRSPARQGFQALDIEAVAKLSDVSQVRVFRPTGSIIW